MKTATRYLEKRMVGDLATVTGGRYRRVRVDDKTLDIEVRAPEKRDWVTVCALSQGTIDLVYLVARLGLVRLVTGDRRPPLIFDDPFVTLDDERAIRALELLRAIAADFQVIYLTTSDRYDEVAASVVELPGPTLVDDAPDPVVDPILPDAPAPAADAAPAATAAARRGPGPGCRRGRPLSGLDPAVATLLLSMTSALTWGAGDFGGGLTSRRTPVFGVVLVSQLVGHGDRGRAGDPARRAVADRRGRRLVGGRRDPGRDRHHRALPRARRRADGDRGPGDRASWPR